MEESNNHIKQFTAADIEKYHQGQLSSKEMHALEKAALDDPFLADALEGYAVSGVNADADIAELKKRLAEKTEGAKVIPLPGGNRSSFRWLRAAAVIIFIAGAGLLSYVFLFNNPTKEIVQSPVNKTDTVNNNEQKADSGSTVHDYKTEAKGDSVTALKPSLNGGTVYIDSSAYVKDISGEKLPLQSETSATENKQGGNPKSVTDSEKKESVAATGSDKYDVTANSPAVASKKMTAADSGFNKPNANISGAISSGDDEKSKDMLAKRKKDSANDLMENEVAFRDQNRRALKAPAPAANNSYSYYNNLRQFHGKITDAHNNPLPFSNVTNTSDNVGTYTDAKGNFTLVSTDSVMEVLVKSLGFENNKIRLKSSINNNQITMQEDRAVTAKILDTVKRNYARVRDGNPTLDEPEPTDGWNSYDTYLANNLNVPDNFDVKESIAGDVVELSFEINKNGEPVNIKVEKSLCKKCDEEAIRLVQQGPKWKRKSKKGKKITVKIPFIKPKD